MSYKTITLLCAVLFSIGCARSVERAGQQHWTATRLNQTKLPRFDVPVTVNDKVVAWIDYFQGPGHNHFARYLSRSNRYIPMMQDTLKKYALTQDLVYLDLIESGF